MLMKEVTAESHLIEVPRYGPGSLAHLGAALEAQGRTFDPGRAGREVR